MTIKRRLYKLTLILFSILIMVLFMHIDFLNSTIKSDAVMIKELELYVSEQNLEHAKYIEYLHTAFEESFLINNEDFQRRLDRINNKIKTLKNKINQTKHEIYTKSLEQ